MKDKTDKQEYLLQDDSGNINPEDFTEEMKKAVEESVKDYMNNLK